MCDLKKESRCASNCFDNSCCSFINEAISGYFRDATAALSVAIPAIITAFPGAIATPAEVTALAALCAGPTGDTLTAFLATFGVTPIPPIPAGPLVAPFAGAVAALCAAASVTPLVAGAPIPAALVGVVGALGPLTTLFDFAALGTGTAFAIAFASVATERAARITALKTKFDDIDRTILAAFQALLCNNDKNKDKDKDNCCQSAADAIRITAINFLRLAITTTTTVGIPALPVPLPGTLPTPGSLQFLLANYDRELEAAVRVILSTVVSDFQEQYDEQCEPCDQRIYTKPGRKIVRPCKPMFEEKCEDNWIEEKKYEFEGKKCEEPKKKYEFEGKKCEEPKKKYEFEDKKCEEPKKKYEFEDKKCEEPKKKYEFEEKKCEEPKKKFEFEEKKCEEPKKDCGRNEYKKVEIPKKDDRNHFGSMFYTDRLGVATQSGLNSRKYDENNLRW